MKKQSSQGKTVPSLTLQQALRSQPDRTSRRRTPMLLCRRREAVLTDRRRSPMLLCRHQSVRQVSQRGKPRHKLASGLRPLGTPVLGATLFIRVIPVRVPLIPLIVGATNPFSIIPGKDSASKGTADAEEK